MTSAHPPPLKKPIQDDDNNDLWDDSELQDSWNDAFAEYKKYHSLAAKGEKVNISSQPQQLESKAETLLANGSTLAHEQQNQQQRPLPSTSSFKTTIPANFIGPAPPALPPPITSSQNATHTQIPTQGTAEIANQQPVPAVAAAAPQTGMPPPPSALASLPQTLLGSGVQDEAMKNIMMSWYYAGYYTGLYDGQQKAWADMQQNVQETG